mmetsp:Transcript_51624/g.85620  ORF Transcript_51624/g.85620 Transcript_51624/m.85620 type:complete len:245 (-) Transcript_51624:162-896(-)|eukprot:CAMPEP_0119341462 /NCGR_PEP_ID=MMETSP1333-20130426/102474_1 /TAXON_ID=418940 /ORGANISM="Scyphosphaera apsteinii, Strain RCC1455" /LENGTH=244 /DNA_ID=CAMNT_0007353439 /DNA_START=27 /DNA_END=761 /DNA_ORIENTATION=-
MAFINNLGVFLVLPTSAAHSVFASTGIGSSARALSCRSSRIATVRALIPRETAVKQLVEWNTTASGCRYVDEFIGTGDQPEKLQVVSVHYTVTLLNSGTSLGTSRGRWPLTFALGKHSVPIWDEALKDMRVGGRRRLIVPPSAIPKSQAARLPPEESIRIDLEVLGIVRGPLAVIPSVLPPGNRRVTIARLLFALSFVPYFLPEEIKPDWAKFGDMEAIKQAREAASNSVFLGGDGSSLDSLFQ